MPVRLRRTVKNSVDSPIMIARVPNVEKRSFHKFIYLTSEIFEEGEKLINFYQNLTKT